MRIEIFRGVIRRCCEADRKLDKFTRTMIYKWLDKHLEGTGDICSSGHALIGGLTGMWRYMIRNYRLIRTIEKERLVILVLEVGNRSKIHDR